MRILLVSGSYPPMHCGVGDYTYSLAHAVAEVPGCKVGVLTSTAAGAAAQEGGVEILPVIETWELRGIPRVLAAVRQWRPDIVHVQFPTQGYGRGHLPTVLPLMCTLMGLPVAQTWHEPRRRISLGSFVWLAFQIFVPGAAIVVRPQFEQMTPGVLKNVFRRKLSRYIPNGPVLPRISLTEAERERIRNALARPNAAMIVHFGFIYPEKGVEALFELADPERHHIVLIGERPQGGPEAYFDEIVRTATSGKWAGKATLAGFLPMEEAARIIAAADAVVLPFRTGGGEWNTSIHSAQVQGTFVLTTSNKTRGYEPTVNTYYAAPGDIDEMRAALSRYVGRKDTAASGFAGETWGSIADAHREVYRAIAARQGSFACHSARAR